MTHLSAAPCTRHSGLTHAASVRCVSSPASASNGPRCYVLRSSPASLRISLLSGPCWPAAGGKSLAGGVRTGGFRNGRRACGWGPRRGAGWRCSYFWRGRGGGGAVVSWQEAGGEGKQGAAADPERSDETDIEDEADRQRRRQLLAAPPSLTGRRADVHRGLKWWAPPCTTTAKQQLSAIYAVRTFAIADGKDGPMTPPTDAASRLELERRPADRADPVGTRGRHRCSLSHFPPNTPRRGAAGAR